MYRGLQAEGGSWVFHDDGPTLWRGWDLLFTWALTALVLHWFDHSPKQKPPPHPLLIQVLISLRAAACINKRHERAVSERLDCVVLITVEHLKDFSGYKGTQEGTTMVSQRCPNLFYIRFTVTDSEKKKTAQLSHKRAEKRVKRSNPHGGTLVCPSSFTVCSDKLQTGACPQQPLRVCAFKYTDVNESWR